MITGYGLSPEKTRFAGIRHWWWHRSADRKIRATQAISQRHRPGLGWDCILHQQDQCLAQAFVLQ
jgi:hypothetical protein